ncbi:MAG: hypothetical protein CMH54_11385 [Myxococcales bacterium]|nr:hypothetical protein [Myxococcales bacterium]|tara:strand:- start:407 stop:1072 length:666 start_codon:yes stop_codon:yes gene_type:complete
MRVKNILVSIVMVSVFLGMSLDAEARRKKSMTGVFIESLTQGAKVYVDGQFKADLPYEDLILLSPGRHVVKVTRRGYATRTEVITLRKGRQEYLEIDLLPTAGIFKIETNVEGARLLLDGKPFGVLPFDGDIPMGRHVLTVVADGYIAAERGMEIQGGKDYEMRFELRLAPPMAAADADSFYTKWWFWTVTGAVVVGGVTGAVLLTGDKPTTMTPHTTLEF